MPADRAPLGQDRAEGPATNTTGWCPRTLPWDDASATPGDASDLLLDAWRPEGAELQRFAASL
jgi:hypothetical protein